MNDDTIERTRNTGGPLGVSRFLPRPAADALVRAHRDAYAIWPDNDFHRAKIIQRAIDKVRKEYPSFFLHDRDSQRQGQDDRGGSCERSLFGQ